MNPNKSPTIAPNIGFFLLWSFAYLYIDIPINADNSIIVPFPRRVYIIIFCEKFGPLTSKNVGPNIAFKTMLYVKNQIKCNIENISIAFLFPNILYMLLKLFINFSLKNKLLKTIFQNHMLEFIFCSYLCRFTLIANYFIFCFLFLFNS